METEFPHFKFLFFPECEAEMSKSMSVIALLRKIAMHPLLTRHHYDDGTLREMAASILADPAHLDADEELVYEDMQVMSDFELHRLCRDTKVCVLTRGEVVCDHASRSSWWCSKVGIKLEFDFLNNTYTYRHDIHN